MTTLEKSLIASYDLSNLLSEEEYETSADYEEWREDGLSYDSYLDTENTFMWEDFVTMVGGRIEAMRNKVHVKGVNLDWRGSEGEKVISVKDSGDAYKVGREFLSSLYSRGIDGSFYLYHVGKYDTGKGFRLVVSHHDAVSTFYVKRA
jgi:hypothetical protein